MSESRQQPAESVAIVGVGLLGGSIAAALKRRFPGIRVTGIGRSSRRLEQALDRGLIDDYATSPAGAAEADLTVVCTPVSRVATDVAAVAQHARSEMLITDVGSVKGRICEAVAAHGLTGTFLGSHPMAGSEKTGFEHADSDLLEGSRCIICPLPETSDSVRTRLTAFWESLGAEVCEMSPQQHDLCVSAISHLPHAIAAALVHGVSDEFLPFAASGFRDTTRIAASDPGLWRDILRANRDAVSADLERFSRCISDLQAAMATDNDDLKQFLEDASQRRRQLE